MAKDPVIPPRRVRRERGLTQGQVAFPRGCPGYGFDTPDVVVRVQVSERPEQLAEHLTGLEGITGTRVVSEIVQATARGITGLLPRVIASAESGGFHVRDISVDEPTLETVFINLTGKDLRE